MALEYRSVPVTAFMQNCSILWCSETRKAAVVDPGGDIERLLSVVEELDVNIEIILLTHGHLDHVGGTAELAKRLSLPIIGPHRDDNFWIEDLAGQATMMGFRPVSSFEPSKWLEQGDSVTLGNETLEVIHCPGHTPGHVVFYSKSAKLAFVGDVLFQGSIGRTDFPRGNYEQLINSIRSNLWALGDDVRFIPGHGPESTFGQERKTNPFVADTRFG